MAAKHWALSGVLLALAGIAVAAVEFNPASHYAVGAAGAEADASQRVIVRLRGDAAVAAIGKPSSEPASALALRAHVTLKQSREILPGLHMMEYSSAAGESLGVTLARLRADPGVQYAEIDQRRYPHALPSDPLFTGQWYLQNALTTPSAVNAQGAWDLATGGNGVVIADLDTGIRYDHPDLQRAAVGGRLLPGYDFVSSAAVANDGDGRDADPSDPGDWLTAADVATAQFSSCTVSGSSWHGTRTAGIIGALANNGAGITGILWSGYILPVRVLGKCGGFDSDILAAMAWAAGIHVNGVPDNPFPARVENLSLGSANACPASYVDVVNQLAARGVLVVASAGNEGGPVDVPANCPGVAAVAGLRHVGTKVGYSSLGPEVAVSAPAGNCVNIGGGPCLFSIDTTSNLGTTVPAADTYTDQINSNVGTSFSAPIVSGIAGLMLSVNGNLTPSQLLARLKEGATKPFPVSSDATIPRCHVPASASDVQSTECSCTTSTCGAGMANALGSVNAALRPIAAIGVPASVSAGQNVVLQGGGSAAACRHSVSSYAWSVVGGGSSPAIQGAQTSTATVVAPSSGSFTLRLTVTDDAGHQDSADVVVTPSTAASSAPAAAGTTACLAAISASIPAVSVSPTTANVIAGSGTQAFSASVANTANMAVTWQVNGVVGGNATVGTVSTAGLYTAPASVPTPATVSVTAVSAADSSRSAAAQVTVTAPAPVTPPPVTPSSGGGGGGGSLDAWSLLLLSLLLCAQMAPATMRKMRIL